MEAVYSRRCSAGDSPESAGQTGIDAGISRTIRFQPEEAMGVFSDQKLDVLSSPVILASHDRFWGK